jgi:hypothetical protein
VNYFDNGLGITADSLRFYRHHRHELAAIVAAEGSVPGLSDHHPHCLELRDDHGNRTFLSGLTAGNPAKAHAPRWKSSSTLACTSLTRTTGHAPPGRHSAAPGMAARSVASAAALRTLVTNRTAPGAKPMTAAVTARPHILAVHPACQRRFGGRTDTACSRAGTTSSSTNPLAADYDD